MKKNFKNFFNGKKKLPPPLKTKTPSTLQKGEGNLKFCFYKIYPINYADK